MRNAIVEMMSVEQKKRDIDWLKNSLQAAIELENSQFDFTQSKRPKFRALQQTRRIGE